MHADSDSGRSPTEYPSSGRALIGNVVGDMKNQWMAYAIVALSAIGAGVAIAGLPNNSPVEATIVAPTNGEVPDTSVAPTTTEPTQTTEAASGTTDAPETTEPTETTEAASTTTEALSDTTDAPVTTQARGSVTADLPERSEIAVGVANGAQIAGAAARNVGRLTGLGYVDVIGFDGTEIVEFTTVYFADGFEEVADRLALDLGLLPIFVAPLADAPSVDNLADDVELLAYIGIDRA